MGALNRSGSIWICHLTLILLATIVRSDLQDMVNPMRKRPRLEITSPLSVVIPEGSLFRLVCTATEHVRPPQDFTWLVNDTVLEEAIRRLHIRGSVRLENSFGEKSSTSELTVVFAKGSDSGLYKCRPVGLTDDRTAVISDTVSVIVYETKVAESAETTSRPFLDKCWLAISVMFSQVFRLGLSEGAAFGTALRF